MEGQTIVPGKYRELARVLGVKATERLCAAYGGKSMYIPMLQSLSSQKRRKCIRDEFMAGSDTAALARKYQLSQRAVQQAVQDLRPRRKRKGT